MLKRELGDLIQRDFHFEAKLVTVQQVDTTPDLKSAHVYISVIGTPEEQHAAMAQLHDRRRPMQAALSKRVILKYTPHLHFVLDEAMERGTRVLDILGELDLPPLKEGEQPVLELEGDEPASRREKPHPADPEADAS